jgi:hypothetical protein
VQGKEGLAVFSSQKRVSLGAFRRYFFEKKTLSQYEIMRFYEIFKIYTVEKLRVSSRIASFGEVEILCCQGTTKIAASRYLEKNILY